MMAGSTEGEILFSDGELLSHSGLCLVEGWTCFWIISGIIMNISDVVVSKVNELEEHCEEK